MTIRLRVAEAATPLPGTLLYRRSDRAFAFKRSSANLAEEQPETHGTASLTIGTLQIEVTITTGALLYVWGYHPMDGWREGALRPPHSRPARLFVEAQPSLVRAVGVAIDDGGEWATTYDRQTGWVCVRYPAGTRGTELLEFAAGTLAELNSNELVALWLLPRIE